VRIAEKRADGIRCLFSSLFRRGVAPRLDAGLVWCGIDVVVACGLVKRWADRADKRRWGSVIDAVRCVRRFRRE
jgi:hypothetical protein